MFSNTLFPVNWKEKFVYTEREYEEVMAGGTIKRAYKGTRKQVQAATSG